jgi:hypothetical protein
MTTYLTPDDLAGINDFCGHHIRAHAHLPPGPLYHYTTGRTLIEILSSGQLWSTQMGCLNDEKELLYAIEQFERRLDARIAAGGDPEILLVLRKVQKRVQSPRPELAGFFVTCFSEDGDDLSQWRAYAGGEGGYALRLDPEKLRDRGLGHNTWLLRVEYEPTNHDVLLGDIIKWTEQFIIQGPIRRGSPVTDAWAEEFAARWLNSLSPFAACIKHPSFRGEREWRLVHWFTDHAERKAMKFVQRGSLITRHIPLAYGEKDGQSHLPLTGVFIGPCRFEAASRVAVGDLLTAKGYNPDTEVTITKTAIPYREV